ncbi:MULTISPECIES: GNAT family N-acetyltransferase [unclassified Streptomyces]|uniref:GNAT family N-acetyltransferase n=1 Tax=unclassified Streptomyces TaxID=2593676 RepID=UPI002B1E6E98|nr:MULTISPECIES: GNAT family N-acetyltransferase [unclassified Streptomyces]
MDPLQTRRLILVPLDADRARRLVAGTPGPEDRWAEGYPDAGDRVGAERYLRVLADTGDPAPYGAFEIQRRSDGLLIGGAGFHGPADEEGGVIAGYGLVPAVRGRGYAAEALRALLEHARAHGAASVSGDTDRENTASQHVMTAAGMLPAGEDARRLSYSVSWKRAVDSARESGQSQELTRHDHVLTVLRGHPDLARTAAESFDFDLDRAEHVEEVRLASGAPLRAVAGDDTGGTFFLCADGAVLYASSEGGAGLIGRSLDEALEILFGLPGWHDHTDLDLSADDEVLEEVFARTEDEIRSSYAPALDADRSTLLSGLGLRRLPRRELLRRLQESLLRTEPEFLLVNADEGCAYEPLDRLRRPPLWEAVLAPGRADLVRMRADPDCWDEIANDPVRRATALRTAQYDRQPGDLQLLRTLLRQEAADRGNTAELRLAAVLVGLHGMTEDHALLRSLREADPDVHFLLGEFPDSAGVLAQWAADVDWSDYGQDPHDEYDLTWTALARRQGRTELARAALIHLLDGTGPRDAALLSGLAREFEALGDLGQAIRALRLYVSLQDDAGRHGSALARLASLQRRHGEVAAAWRSLQEAVSVLDGPLEGLPPLPPTDQPELDLGLGLPKPPCRKPTWRELGLGVSVAEEHFLIARAAVPLGLHEVAREALRAGTAMRDA